MFPSVRHADGAGGARLLAFVFGWFAFRSRVTGVYLSIITQAMTYALLLAFFRNDMGFGGNNGLTDFKDILGFNVQAAGHARRAVRDDGHHAGAGFLIARGIVRSKLGKVLVAVRDAESGTRFLGLPGRASSSSSSPSRPAWPASPARSMCRRSASSIRASSRRPIRSRW
jgi:ABC-type branched-subunit amino acid transport system permease subunit